MSNSDQLSLADQLMNANGQRSRATKRLADIEAAIEWGPLFDIAAKVDKTDKNKGGRPRKPARWMVKAMFLKHLYGLSDPELEDQLIDRLSFRRFVGLPLEQPVPDFSTFWRFAEALASEGLIDELFAEINRQLERQGLLLKQGTIVDAAIMASTGRPTTGQQRREQEKAPSPQIDRRARSTKKRGIWYFGYKGHIGLDAGSKLIRRVAFSPANRHDSHFTDKLVSEDERALFGDKAYGSDALKQQARAAGWYYGIQDKGRRGRALSQRQRDRNRKLAGVRNQVEHPFAAFAQQYGTLVARAKNEVRNRARFLMGCLCWNLERSLNLGGPGKIRPLSAG